MILRPPPAAPTGAGPELAQRTVELLSCLPAPERVRKLQEQRWLCF